MQEKKEVKKWEDEEALKRYRMIAPLLEADLDEGKNSSCGKKPQRKTAYPKEAFTGMRRCTGTADLKGCVQ